MVANQEQRSEQGQIQAQLQKKLRWIEGNEQKCVKILKDTI